MNFINQLLAGANILRMNFQMPNKMNPILETEEKPDINEQRESLANQLIQQSLLSNYLIAQSFNATPTTTGVQSKSKKISKRVNECGHQDKEHYAKGMCNNCYHRFGRTKKPWICGHEKLYAQGLCQNCYINKYNQKRREHVEPEEENLPIN